VWKECPREIGQLAGIGCLSHLRHSAGYAPAYPQTSLDDPALAAVRTALRHILTGHLPYPAINVYRLALHPRGKYRIGW
jgi:hypothetical protein